MTQRNGFTLVELSVVMVIIALIIGAVAGARTMIRTAELQQVVSEYGQYTTAVGEFVAKYHALPGDFNYDATTFWGSDTCPTGGANTAKRITCNGDGSGTIGTSVAGVSSVEREWFRAWQHLANAEFISGTYSGVTAGAAASAVSQIGINVPQSKNGKMGWTLMYYATGASNTAVAFANTSGHVFIGGTQTASGITDSGAFTPGEVLGIDAKLDDGLPGKGKVRTARTNNCMVDNTNVATGYVNTGTALNCAIYFWPGF